MVIQQECQIRLKRAKKEISLNKLHNTIVYQANKRLWDKDKHFYSHMNILQQINNPKQKVKEIWNERSMTKTIYMLITVIRNLTFCIFF